MPALVLALVPSLAGIPDELGMQLINATHGRKELPATSLANLLMLISPRAVHIPAPVGAVIVGGFYHLTFCVCFLVSLITCDRMGSVPDRIESGQP